MVIYFTRIVMICLLLAGCAKSDSGLQGNLGNASQNGKDGASKSNIWPVNIWNIPQRKLSVTFYAPSLQRERVIERKDRYYRLARHQRLTVSLNFAKPNCVNNQSAGAHIKCLLAKIRHNPHIKIDENTISQLKHKDGQVLTYMTLIGTENHKMKVINTHLVFERNGEWGDFHASMLEPNHREFLTMLKFSSWVSLTEKKSL